METCVRVCNVHCASIDGHTLQRLTGANCCYLWQQQQKLINSANHAKFPKQNDGFSFTKAASTSLLIKFMCV